MKTEIINNKQYIITDVFFRSDVKSEADMINSCMEEFKKRCKTDCVIESKRLTCKISTVILVSKPINIDFNYNNIGIHNEGNNWQVRHYLKMNLENSKEIKQPFVYYYCGKNYKFKCKIKNKGFLELYCFDIEKIL